MSKQKVQYLIIGNSAGGIRAAEAIRGIDGNGAMAIISDEPYPAYSRPMISDYLAGKYTLERMLYRDEGFYARHNIQLILGQRVTQIDTGGHSARLENGEIIGWDKLLLATGGRPIVPEIEGGDHDGIFNFITLDDAKAIDSYLGYQVAQAVVIGGGLIGVSVTEALVKRGLKVTIVEMKERLLNTILDEAASALVEARLAESGVSIITGHTVAAVSGSPVTGVTLEDGRAVPAGMVVVAIGVQPRIELAAGAGLKVARGIVVDRRMATSAADVYACGDAAAAYDFVYGDNRLTPIWPNAGVGGRVAGANMAGVTTEYPGGTSVNSLKYFGLAIVSAGIVSPPDASYEVLSSQHDRNYKKVIVQDGLLAGMVYVGDIERAGIVYSLMKNRVDVSAFKASLVDEDFGLASLPEDIWRPHLKMPASLAPAAVAAALPEETNDGYQFSE